MNITVYKKKISPRLERKKYIKSVMRNIIIIIYTRSPLFVYSFVKGCSSGGGGGDAGIDGKQ